MRGRDIKRHYHTPTALWPPRTTVHRVATGSQTRSGVILPQRIAIGIAVPALALSIFATSAVATSMPTRFPDSHTTASAAPHPSRVTAQALATAPAGAAKPPGTTTVVLLRPMAPTIATAYDAWAQGNACPGFPQTQKTDLTMASDLVACRVRIKVCINGRCVVVQKRDTGPFRDGRHIDLNLGAVWALGFRSLYHFGVRDVTWAPVRANRSRSVASAK